MVDHFGWIDHFLPGSEGHLVVDALQAGQVTDDTSRPSCSRRFSSKGEAVDPQLVGGGDDLRQERTQLTVWFLACSLFATQKDGISARSPQRALGIGTVPF
jgi:hypothetical protein